MPLASPLEVRAASPADGTRLAPMIRALAFHEGKREVEHITAAAVAGWLSGPQPAFHAFLAEAGGRMLGYLAWYPTFSPFKGSGVLLVENLWVEPEGRGLGAGRALLAALAREAQRRSIGRIDLTVRSENEEAHRFYTRLGFSTPGEEVCRLEDAAISRLSGAPEQAASGGAETGS